MTTDNPKPNIVFDASQLDTFDSCHCKFNYRHNLNKTTATKASPLERGGLIHTSLEAYYKSLQAKNTFDQAVASLEAAFQSSLIQSDLDQKLIDTINDTLHEYVDYWRVFDQNFTINDVEKPFIYLLSETDDFRLYMAGKIDLLITDERYTNLPVDHKSHQREHPTYRMTNQFINYALATKSNFLLVNKIGLQKTLTPEQKFRRVPLSYDPIFIEQWKTNVVRTMYSYISCVADDKWEMNLTSCDKFNRQCEYYDVCDSSGEQAKLFKLEANYVDGEVWDVSKILEKTT